MYKPHKVITPPIAMAIVSDSPKIIAPNKTATIGLT
jgi:hypothetical protein